jgi:aromatic ring-opening dioxygenase catalytic subunit (LigB family)
MQLRFTIEKLKRQPELQPHEETTMENMHRGQIIYFSHGGGPLPILGDEGHQAMIRFMGDLPARLKRPDVILVISAHWEESTATLTGASNPSMFFDYYGFPDEAYEIDYPAPGAPDLAHRIANLLGAGGIPARVNQDRGFDHGLYIPLMLMYPDAGIPALQLSLIRGLDPSVHISLGKALRELMHENILVIGSGFSFHNMRAFSWDADNIPDPENDAFQEWLIESCTTPLPQPEREKRLSEWQGAPSARYCHPREEHLMPLHVCLGMAESPGVKIFDDHILGKRSVAFLWSSP